MMAKALARRLFIAWLKLALRIAKVGEKTCEAASMKTWKLGASLATRKHSFRHDQGDISWLIAELECQPSKSITEVLESMG